MSSRKGSTKKKGQKHQNSSAFKNNLHDTSRTTKLINELDIGGVCERCRGIIEWRRKFKKYKPLAVPKKCVKCEQKTVKHAYHIICMSCASKDGVCEKCGIKADDIKRSEPSAAAQAAKASQLQEELKYLTERQRRAFFRGSEQSALTTKDDDGRSDGNKEETDENVDDQVT